LIEAKVTFFLFSPLVGENKSEGKSIPRERKTYFCRLREQGISEISPGVIVILELVMGEQPVPYERSESGKNLGGGISCRLPFLSQISNIGTEFQKKEQQM
jgi:hypothetical protein